MSFFQLAPISGAVDSGVNKAVQTVTVFVAADWAFCDAEFNPRACFSGQKGQSLVLVVSGVLLYSYFSAAASKGGGAGKAGGAAGGAGAGAAEEEEERGELLQDYHTELGLNRQIARANAQVKSGGGGSNGAAEKSLDQHLQELDAEEGRSEYVVDSRHWTPPRSGNNTLRTPGPIRWGNTRLLWSSVDPLCHLPCHVTVL